MPSDFGKISQKVSRFRDNLEDEHNRATEESMEELRVEVRNTISSNNSVARGTLIRDVRENETPQRPQMVARSVNVPRWSRYVEHGTGIRARRDTLPDHEQYKAPDPMPPIEPIETWVIAKNITSDEYSDPLSLAKAVQRDIGEMGTAPHPFMRPAWYGSRGYRNVIDANKRAFRRAWRRS